MLIKYTSHKLLLRIFIYSSTMDIFFSALTYKEKDIQQFTSNKWYLFVSQYTKHRLYSFLLTTNGIKE